MLLNVNFKPPDVNAVSFQRRHQPEDGSPGRTGSSGLYKTIERSPAKYIANPNMPEVKNMELWKSPVASWISKAMVMASEAFRKPVSREIARVW